MGHKLQSQMWTIKQLCHFLSYSQRLVLLAHGPGGRYPSEFLQQAGHPSCTVNSEAVLNGILSLSGDLEASAAWNDPQCPWGLTANFNRSLHLTTAQPFKSTPDPLPAVWAGMSVPAQGLPGNTLSMTSETGLKSSVLAVVIVVWLWFLSGAN
jgi:hypothetical protein